MKKGYFIVIEGADGTGKTTLAEKLKDKFNHNGYDAICLSDSNGTQASLNIKNTIFDKENPIKNKFAQVLMFCAARYLTVEEVIKPALDEGKIVICDRWVYTTMIYADEWYRNIDHVEFNVDLLRESCGGLYPDAMAVLIVEYSIAQKRMNQREESNFYDEEKAEFHKNINKQYFKLGQSHGSLYDTSYITPDKLAYNIYSDCIEKIGRVEKLLGDNFYIKKRDV